MIRHMTKRRLSVMVVVAAFLFSGLIPGPSFAATGDYVNHTQSSNTSLNLFHDHADLPAAFHNYVVNGPEDTPPGAEGSAVLYFDSNTLETIYCADITKDKVDPKPGQDDNPSSGFNTTYKRDLLTYVLLNGQKICDKTNDAAVRMQLATQICVYLIAEGVYPGGSAYSQAAYDAVLGTFPPDSATGDLARTLMQNALAYASSPTPQPPGGEFAFPSFTYKTKTEAEAAPVTMAAVGSNYKVTLKDSSNALRDYWKKEITGSSKFYLDVKEQSGLNFLVHKSDNEMDITGDPGEKGTTIEFESGNFHFGVNYLHTNITGAQDMVRFARIVSNESSTPLYLCLKRAGTPDVPDKPNPPDVPDKPNPPDVPDVPGTPDNPNTPGKCDKSCKCTCDKTCKCNCDKVCNCYRSCCSDKHYSGGSTYGGNTSGGNAGKSGLYQGSGNAPKTGDESDNRALIIILIAAGAVLGALGVYYYRKKIK